MKSLLSVVRVGLLALPAVVISSAACAVRTAEAVRIQNAWVSATVPGQRVAGAYMEITSPAAAALTGVQTPVARAAEMHTMKVEDGVMKMRAVKNIDLPARRVVKLAPGGQHVMLLDVDRALKPGERVPLTLIIRSADGVRSTVKIQAEVRSAADHGH